MTAQKGKTASKNNRSGASAGKGGKGRPPAKNQKQRRGAEHPDEIAGLILMAVGIVLGILTYTNTGAVMHAFVNWLFGLMGVAAYAMPVLLFALGVAVLVLPNRQIGTGAVALVLGTVYCINCIIQLAVSPVGGSKFADYVRNAWSLGAAHRQGGGALASVSAFAFAKLFSKAGAIVLFVAAALVMLLVLTRVSIRSAGKKVIEKVDEIEDRRKSRLYNGTIEDDEDEDRAAAAAERKRAREERRKKRERQDDPLFIDEDPTPVLTPVYEGGAADPLDFLPQSGALPQRRADDDAAEIDPFDVTDRSGVGGDAGLDPFGSFSIADDDVIPGVEPEELQGGDIGGKPERCRAS